MAYTLNDWNKLIDKINNVIQNPPPGGSCNPLPPLPHVSAPHLWSWLSDVKKAQDTIKQICGDTTFTQHKLWEQSIIDELQDAIDAGWCNCSSFVTITVATYPNEGVFSDCGNPYPPPVNAANLVIGMKLSHPPGTRIASVSLGGRSKYANSDYLSGMGLNAYCILSGDVITNVLQSLGPPPTAWAMVPGTASVDCNGDCESKTCMEALQTAYSESPQVIADSRAPQYNVLTLSYTILK